MNNVLRSQTAPFTEKRAKISRSCFDSNVLDQSAWDINVKWTNEVRSNRFVQIEDVMYAVGPHFRAVVDPFIPESAV